MSIEPTFLRKHQLESKAEQLLAKYRGGEHLREAKPLDIEHFAEFQLEANIDYQRLTPNGSILGMSVFQDLKTSVINDVGAKVDLVFRAQTIVIDYDALSGSPWSRTRFTIAHECAHLVLHQHIYYRDPKMKCSGNNGYQPFAAASENAYKETRFNRAEFQANYFGAALVMPRDPFTAAFNGLLPGSWHTLDDHQKQSVVATLAEMFGASREAIAYRIKHLELVA